MEQKKVVIICYSYSDGFAYMEQKLAKAFVALRCDVLVVCSTANRIDSKTVVHVEAQEYETDGYKVCRLPFITGGHLPDHKMPIILKGMYRRLNIFNPDFVYHMSCSAVNLLSVKKYMKTHPEARLYIDNHASLANSVNNPWSKYILHGLIYKPLLHMVDKYVKQYFYVGYGEKKFIEDFYQIDKKKCSFFSLGDFIIDEITYKSWRDRSRKTIGIKDNDIVVTYSGKFTRRKKTIEIINMMMKLLQRRKDIHFLLVGQVQDATIEDVFDKYIRNAPPNFHYLGWRKSDELRRLLCCSDIYIQFEPSSTFQTALCSKCYGITGNVDKTYELYPDGIFAKIKSIEEMEEELSCILESGRIEDLRKRSYTYAISNLDYIGQIRRMIFEK